jgi:hypothetical protein
MSGRRATLPGPLGVRDEENRKSEGGRRKT